MKNLSEYITDSLLNESKITLNKLNFVADITDDYTNKMLKDSLINEKEKKENTKVDEEIIVATDKTIIDIVKSEIKRLGNNADLNHIDVSKVTNMSFVFEYSNFNGDISKWDVSKVEIMRAMFEYSNFKGDISKWDVSKVRNMSEMFYNSQFNGDISKWDVSNVDNMMGMFDKSPLEKQPEKQPNIE